MSQVRVRLVVAASALAVLAAAGILVSGIEPVLRAELLAVDAALMVGLAVLGLMNGGSRLVAAAMVGAAMVLTRMLVQVAADEPQVHRDAITHLGLTAAILRENHIPVAGFSYADFPAIHLLLALAVRLTGLPLFWCSIGLVAVLAVAGLLLVSALARRRFGGRAVLAGIALVLWIPIFDPQVLYQPLSLGLVVIAFVLAALEIEPSLRRSVLVLAAIATLTVTHLYTGAIVASVVALALLLDSSGRRAASSPTRLAVLVLLVPILYWIFEAGILGFIIRLVPGRNTVDVERSFPTKSFTWSFWVFLSLPAWPVALGAWHSFRKILRREDGLARLEWSLAGLVAWLGAAVVYRPFLPQRVMAILAPGASPHVGRALDDVARTDRRKAVLAIALTATAGLAFLGTACLWHLSPLAAREPLPRPYNIAPTVVEDGLAQWSDGRTVASTEALIGWRGGLFLPFLKDGSPEHPAYWLLDATALKSVATYSTTDATPFAIRPWLRLDPGPADVLRMDRFNRVIDLEREVVWQDPS